MFFYLYVLEIQRFADFPNRYLAMSIQNAMPIEAVSTPTKEVNIRVVYHQKGRYYIDLYPISQHDSAPTAMKKLVQKHDLLVYSSLLWIKRFDVFRTSTVKIATISPVRFPFLLTRLS